MKTLRNIKISRKSLYSHKLRTVLALSGITIGVASVIVMTAIGRGAERAVIGKINEMGTNLLVVNAGKLKKTGIRAMQGSSIQTLTLEDSEAIAQECNSVALAVPGKDQTLKVMYGNFSTQTKIFGTLPAFTEIRNFKLVLGRFFSEEENKASFRLAVIGAEVHKNIFDGKDPLGEIIRISNVPFKVIGVLKAKGVSAEGSNEDNQIIIPIKTALRRVFNIDYISQVFVRSKSLKLMDNTEAEIKDLLRERHRLSIRDKPDDFLIDNLLTVINAQKETSRSFGNLITGISAISLFVGGIGILAVMLLAVKERTPEIGLRLATGARPRDILVQFLTESLILGAAGGAIGAFMGTGMAWLAAKLTELQTYISVESIFLSLSVSLTIGLFFGVVPARKAALLNPIEALHAE